jgi:hypothetical protein
MQALHAFSRPGFWPAVLRGVAWGNVYHFCAQLVAFYRAGDAQAWIRRHGFPLGQVLPIAQLGELARRWYGGHADRAWTKWSIPQARDIFASVD